MPTFIDLGDSVGVVNTTISMLDVYAHIVYYAGIAMTDVLQGALHEVRTKIASKTQQRDRLNAEIAQLQATEIGLQNALGQQIQAEIAWTNLVRTVIHSAGMAMSAVEVRDTLGNWGYDFAGIKNPLAFFNTILQRLAEQGEIMRSDTGRPFRFSR